MPDASACEDIDRALANKVPLIPCPYMSIHAHVDSFNPFSQPYRQLISQFWQQSQKLLALPEVADLFIIYECEFMDAIQAVTDKQHQERQRIHQGLRPWWMQVPEMNHLSSPLSNFFADRQLKQPIPKAMCPRDFLRGGKYIFHFFG